MPSYLLPCECGEAVPIQTTQAGETVTCSCGQTLEVPPMRAMRQLEMVGDIEEKKQARKSEWGPVRGGIFALGFILVLIGIGLTGRGMSVNRHMDRDLGIIGEALDRDYDRFAHDVDVFNAEQTLDLWFTMREAGLGPRDRNPYVMSRRMREETSRMLIAGVVVTILGVLLAAGAVIASFASAQPNPSN